MEIIRVLHVVTYMGRGGIETMLMNYYRNIDRSKIQFDFLVHRDFEADYDKEILELGGRIFRLPPLNPINRNYLKKLDHFFEEHKEYRIVHSHVDCLAGIPLKYAKKYGVPCRIAHAHNSNQVKNFKYIIKLLCKRNIPKYATDLFACGIEAGKWMYKDKRFSVLNNAIDVEKYVYNESVRNEVRKEFGIHDNTLVVGHVGRFAPQKNHTFLIDIFYEVQKLYENATLLLVGEGPLEEEVRIKVETMGISEKVLFAGLRTDVNRMLQAMDIFVLPSLFEGLCLVGIEAQAAGLPCVLSNQVPLECKMVEGLVYQVPLEESPKIWAEEILKKANVLRVDTSKNIIEKNYDIKNNARELAEYYINNYK